MYTLNQPSLGRRLEGLPRQRTSGTSVQGRERTWASGPQADISAVAPKRTFSTTAKGGEWLIAAVAHIAADTLVWS